MKRAVAGVLFLSFLALPGLWALESDLILAQTGLEVPEVMGPGAFLVGVDTGGAVINGPFCDQPDIICDARCTKLEGEFTCVGGGPGFCSVSNCTGGS